uniref:Alpha-tubulin N-acetyltransferase n=1 Tax=Cacopsylla melanoneura TaxID=428564 RepID=A0A8D9DYC7_9HEMI
MEFNFDIRSYFSSPIVTIHNSLIPAHFQGDKRELNLCYQHMSEIIDKIGAASAIAQGLQKPITSALKILNSEHTLYLLTDRNGGPKKHGVVIGLLKMGWKNLFLFNKAGECIERNTLCILDFYVHESMQRMGCGNALFEHMLQDMKVLAHQLAIDKPSQKFLCFLNKHYGLSQIVPQNNHFVVFSQFFDDISKKEGMKKKAPWSCKDKASDFVSKPTRHLHSQLW